MAEEADISKLKQVETSIIKCKSCGGTMVFDPNTQTLKCEHCGNTEEIDKDVNVLEQNILEGFEKGVKLQKGEVKAYKCHNCGATVMLNPEESAVICPFCSTSNIVLEENFEGLKPQVVVPFSFDGTAATEYAKKWAKKRIFAPRKFKKELYAENMRGVYEPCYTYDSATHSSYKGRVGDRHTRTVGTGKNRRTETYIVYRNVKGEYDKTFDDVLVSNNLNFSQAKIDSLQPFDLSGQVVYERKYLSGYCSEVYQKDVKEGWTDAKKIMDKRIYDDIVSSVHCDVVDYMNVSTVHSGVTYKYVLLPVYYMIYRFKGKDYGVSVNGSNGRSSGKTPISPWRVLIASVIGLAIFALFAYLFYKYNA